jgi:glyoxylase I family protein
MPESNTSDSLSQRERVLGIGGFFFRCRDPKALAAWYRDQLGIDPAPADYGQPVWQQAAGPTVFAPFPKDTDYFGSSAQAWSQRPKAAEPKRQLRDVIAYSLLIRAP